MEKRMKKILMVLSVSVSMIAPSIAPAVPVMAEEILDDSSAEFSEDGSFSLDSVTQESDEVEEASIDETVVYKDGEYTGTGKGFKGDITVKVTVKDGKIASIDEVSQEETPKKWARAWEIVKSIIEKQSTDVDDISHATYSSKGIKAAVNDALKDAVVIIFASGIGTEDTPYIIANAEQLAAFAASVDEGNPYTDEFIELGADIDLSGTGNWNPIGTEAQTTKSVDTIFNGHFDGKDHKISNLKIHDTVSSAKSLGLFSTLNGSAEVKNIAFENVDIEIKAEQKTFVGSVAGDTVAGSPVVDHVSASGKISIAADSVKMTMNGGILGRAMKGAVITNCYTDVEQKNEDPGEWVNSYVAGIVGMSSLNNVIVNCGSTGSIENITPASTGLTGGIAGMFAGKLWNVYSTSDIRVVNSTGKAGFTGAIAGQITTSGMTNAEEYPAAGALRDYAYYASDAKLNVSSSVDTDGIIEMIASGTGSPYDKAFKANAMKKAEMSEDSFADLLNGNASNVRVLLNAYDVTGVKMNAWVMSGNKVIVGNDKAENGEEVSDIFASGNGSAEDPYVIETASQLKAFAASLDDTFDYTGIFIALANDIDISGSDWKPVGGSDYAFNGTFDGKGHTISGMTAGSDSAAYEMDATPYYGLFGVLECKAVVKNVTLSNVNINAVSKKSVMVAGIAGYMQGVSANNTYAGAVIDNVSVQGKINLTTDAGNNYVAGIAGMQYKGSIINSTVDMDVNGVVKDSSLAEVGGLVALCNRGLVANSSAYGTVYGSGSRVLREGADEADEGMAIVSPLVACNAGSLVNCYASADIETKEYSKYAGMVSGWITGIGKSYRCWYDADKKMTVNGSAVDPVSAVGTVISKGVSDETFESYAGGLTFELTPVSGNDISKASEGLNKSFGSLPIEITSFGIKNDSLRKWSWHKDEEKNLADGDNAAVTYTKPNVENRKEEVVLEMMDGTWYGRSTDKNTVVKITTENNKVTGTEVISGDKSGKNYEEALETARSRAVYGDFTDYAAADTSVFDGGNGTEESPYLVSTEKQLRYIAEAINADVTWNNVWFRQTGDIKVSEEEFLPIGFALQQYNTSTGAIKTAAVHAFEGNYDGADHTISGLRIGNGKKYGHIFTNGMFGLVQGDYPDRFLHDELRKSVIKNVQLKDVKVTTSNEYDTTAATLIGQGQNGTFIENCSAEDSEINASCDERSARVGGLAGSMVYGEIRDSKADVSVKAEVKKNFAAYVGGFVGITNRATIINCYTLGDVTAKARDYNKTTVGGFIGLDASAVVNCYSKGNVTSESTTGDIGAFAGRTAGIASNAYDYYDAKTVLTVAGKAKDTVYAGADPYSVIAKNKTVGNADTTDKAFAEKMNGTVKNMTTVLNDVRAEYSDENDQTKFDKMYIYYTGDGSDLYKWTLLNGVTVFGEKGGNDAPAPVNPETPETNVPAYTEVSFPTSDGSTITLSRNNATGVYTDAEGDIAVVISTNEISDPDKKGNAKADTSARYSYAGKKLKPGVKSYVVVDGTAYVYGKDYKVSVKGGLHAGKLTAVYKFKKNAAVYKAGIKKITQSASVEAKTVTAEDVTVKLNKKQTKVVSIVDKETKKKISKKNYTVDMSARTVTFKGDYAGTVKF